MNWRDHGPAKIRDFGQHFYVLVIFHTRSYWFVTFRSFISYWSLILCDYQLPCSTKPLLTTGVTLRQNVKKMMIFFKNMKFWILESKTFPFAKISKFEKVWNSQNIWKFQFFKAKHFPFRKISNFGKWSIFESKTFPFAKILKFEKLWNSQNIWKF